MMIAGIGYLALLRAVPAADHAVDPGLLEYLGSVDSEDRDWHDYLAHTDIDQVARRAEQSRRAPPQSLSAPVQPTEPATPPSPPKPPTAGSSTTPAAAPAPVSQP